MKVEIWSDYVCPFCYIGKTKFEAALRQFEHRDRIETVYRSFELDPGADPSAKRTTYEMLSAKYGMSLEQAKATSASVAAQGAAEGLAFHFDGAIETNTFDAHRLTHFAAAHGKASEFATLAFRAHFTDNDDLSDRGKLAELAAQAGLDAGAAEEALASGAYADAVREDEAEARRLDVRGVPFFVIDRKYAVSGAQSSDVFLEVLNKAWSEGRPTLVQADPGDGGVCTDESCMPKPSDS